MAAYVGLLRGINVGGRKKVAMADLRHLLESAGYGQVETYLQSGNVLLDAPQDAATVARTIAESIKSEIGLDVSVVVRTPQELAAVVDRNPFPDATAVPAQLHVAFLSQVPPQHALANLDAPAFAPDQMVVAAREAYVWYRNGAGRSKLSNDVLERRLGVTSTMRNWNTVTKLLALAEQRG